MNPAWSRRHGNFILSTDKALLQIPRVHRFLSTDAYWCRGIPLEIVEKAARNSLCFGLYDESQQGLQQIGYARAVTDGATFAWICDVYIEPEFRQRGLSKWLIAQVMSHPDLQGLRRICLATKDAHGLYARYGFKVTETPDLWMEIKDNDIYKRAPPES